MVGGQTLPLDDGQRLELKALLDDWAHQGRRTLALATRRWTEGEPFTKEDAETGLVLLGLTGMVDPPRPEVAEAVALCFRAGIRMVMVTGDYGPTALAIANEIGMSTADLSARVYSGRDVEALGAAGLKEILRVPGPLIFARMEPAHKMEVVTAFKDLGEIVAVTGDGINDAAALKRADIGIAMGAGVNDVVKEAASMVVLDGNFASIVAAVQEGRAVYANIRRFVTYVFASNVPELVPFLVSVLAGLPLPLTVLQILAVDLGTDMIPALGLGAEPPEPGLMDLPPRARTQRLFDASVFVRGYLFLGLLEAALSLAAYFWAYAVRGWVPGQVLVDHGPVYQAATTMALAGIVACQVGNVLACRTQRASLFRVGLGTNPLVLWGIASELVVLTVLIEVPFFQGVFGLVPLGWSDLALLPLFPVVMLGAEELRKLVVRRRALRVAKAR
jgi:magnesium-transporting ATPase (P-type)